jgi:hypothetical protein
MSNPVAADRLQDVDPYLKALAASLLRGLLPYPDPARRRRVCGNARALVACEPWPDDAATTGPDVAQLALLRVLSLQQQIRRAARTRQREAAVLLARSSLESCILGIYCLHKNDAVERLRAANIKAMVEVMGYLIDDGLMPKDVFEQCLQAIGEPRRGPSVWDMVQLVEKTPDGAGAVSLYRRFYVPTSTFFVHANAASLLRHVKSDNTITERPMFPWTARSAVRVGDACVGILATAVAKSAAVQVSEFGDYAEAHIKRAFTPLAVMAGKGLGRTLKPAQILGMVREIRTMRRYYSSGQAVRDPADVREARVRAVFAKYTEIVFDPGDLDPSVPAAAFQPFIDYLVGRVLNEIATLPGDHRAARSPASAS